MSYEGATGEASAVAVLLDEARRLDYPTGTVARFVATGEVTAGRYGLYRWELPPRGGGAGGHFHRTFSEAFYVIDGTPSFFDGRAWTARAAGDFVYVPEGGIHGFRNDADTAATMLILFAPGGAREGYFEELLRIRQEGRSMSTDDWTELYARWDQTMVEE